MSRVAVKWENEGVMTTKRGIVDDVVAAGERNDTMCRVERRRRDRRLGSPWRVTNRIGRSNPILHDRSDVVHPRHEERRALGLGRRVVLKAPHCSALEVLLGPGRNDIDSGSADFHFAADDSVHVRPDNLVGTHGLFRLLLVRRGRLGLQSRLGLRRHG